MTFWKRLRFYMVGASLGICIVLIFFGPKAVQCSYFPNARALEEAKIYPMTFSKTAAATIETEKIDSLFLANEIFKKSKITNFGTDEVRAKPCRIYRAEYREAKSFDLVYEICQKKTVIRELKRID